MSLPAFMASKVRESDCLLWIGATNNRGYGLVTVDGKVELAHRVAYAAEHGPIAAGLVIDHVCRSRNCVRVEHLEAVTSGENQRRGRLAAGLQVGDTCINGHLIANADQLYVRDSGAIECRPCRASAPRRRGRRRPTVRKSADSVRADLDRSAAS